MSQSFSKSSHSHSHRHGHYHFRHRDYRSWSHFCWYPRYGCYGCYTSYAYAGGYGCGGGCHGCYGGSSYAPRAPDYGPPPPAGEPIPPPAPGAPGKPERKSGTEARLIIELPADAALYVDDQRMKSSSSHREFTTPALDRRATYYYILRAELVVDGQRHSETKQVILRAGERIKASFPELQTFVAARTLASAVRWDSSSSTTSTRVAVRSFSIFFYFAST